MPSADEEIAQHPVELTVAQVDALYARALELGGTDERPPGERFPGFYAAYFRDLDGNKLNISHMVPGHG